MGDATLGRRPDSETGIRESLRAAVADRLGTGRFDLWFGEGVSLKVSGNRLEVRVPNAFFRDWIRSHFADSLLDAGREVTGRSLDLSFHVSSEMAVSTASGQESSMANSLMLSSNGAGSPLPMALLGRQGTSFEATPAPGVAGTPVPIGSSTSSRPLRRLEDFVTGPNNRLVHAACVEMVQQLGSTCSPLVIHGGIGLGKTHLLEGIVRAWRARRPAMKILFITAESFTNSFLEALRLGTLPAFRSRLRSSDALLVDDVHFVASKRATQDEFLHTFNSLYAKGAPIVLTSDQHPRQVPRLTEELATRFVGGMVLKIETPDAATRRQILKTKALIKGIDVPDPVIHYIAEHLRSSVRELEGALNSIIAHATLTGRKLDLSLAKTALCDTIRHTPRSLGLKDVEKAVCDLFQVDAEDLKSESRARSVSYPRMLAMYLARKHVQAPYSEIGRYFGGRNYSTVIAAEKKVESWLNSGTRVHRLDGFETTTDVVTFLEAGLSG